MNLFEQQEYDLILLDIQMPEIDGVELMQMMRNHQPQMQTPIVAITANIHEDEKERLLKLGFDAFLGKPLEEGKLKRLLEHDVEPVVTVQRSDESVVAEQPDQEPISIDFELSLKLSGNNEQLCLDMLKMLHQGIEDYRQQLRNAIDMHSLGKLAYLVHKLQGITCYTGLPRLKQLLTRYDALKHIDTEQTMQVCEEVILELSRIDQLLEESLKHSSAEICAGKMAGSA